MKKKPEKRALEKVHHVDVIRADGDLNFEFRGTNNAGKITVFRIKAGWWLWPYLVREVAKAWIAERTGRIETIQRLNASFVDTLQKEETKTPQG